MFFRKPKLTLSAESPSYDLLRDSLEQFDISIGPTDGERQLQSLEMDDIELLEAIQLVEAAIGGKISRQALGPSTTIAEVAALFDEVRRSPQR